MLARVVCGPVCPGRRDEAIRLYEQSVLPTLQAQAGFNGALLLTERSSGYLVALTLWDETTMEVDPACFRRLLALFDGLLAAPFTVEHYEVSAASLASVALRGADPSPCR